MNIDTLTHNNFKDLPLVTKGESKEVRYAGDGEVVIELKPTIYSYTHNRAGVIPGSDVLRLRAIQKLLPVLEAAGVRHTYKAVNDKWILSELVLQPQVKGVSQPFRPTDLNPQQLENLPVAPPIEVIAKARHTGTSKHRYFNFSNWPLRDGNHIGAEEPYPEPIIRFDWRNPMHHPVTNERFADEILPEQVADWFIDANNAQCTARLAFDSLNKHMKRRGMDLWDICFFITEDGNKLFGEVSPDCMRVRALGGCALDKDVWRTGGSSGEVIDKWGTMVELLETSDEVS